MHSATFTLGRPAFRKGKSGHFARNGFHANRFSKTRALTASTSFRSVSQRDQRRAGRFARNVVVHVSKHSHEPDPPTAATGTGKRSSKEHTTGSKQATICAQELHVNVGKPLSEMCCGNWQHNRLTCCSHGKIHCSYPSEDCSEMRLCTHRPTVFVTGPNSPVTGNDNCHHAMPCCHAAHA